MTVSTHYEDGVKIQFVKFNGFFTSHQQDLLSSLVINKFINKLCSQAGGHVNAASESAALPIRAACLSELTDLKGRPLPF
jgi:hypothetical protein